MADRPGGVLAAAACRGHSGPMRPHLLLAAAVAVCALAACSGADPVVEPTDEPTVEATATPDEPPTEPAVAGDPVTVAVGYVDVQLLDNAVLRGQDQREPADGVVEDAVEQARAAVERYLTTQFVEPGTRYGDAGHTALLVEGAADDLDEEERRGLGELDLAVTASPVGPFDAQAVVLTDGDDLLSVTMVYDVSFTLDDGTGEEGQLRQHGHLLFPADQPDAESWRAELLELTLELPEEPTP